MWQNLRGEATDELTTMGTICISVPLIPNSAGTCPPLRDYAHAHYQHVNNHNSVAVVFRLVAFDNQQPLVYRQVGIEPDRVENVSSMPELTCRARAVPPR